jgi:hypothetical protein
MYINIILSSIINGDGEQGRVTRRLAYLVMRETHSQVVTIELTDADSIFSVTPESRR